MASDHGRWVTQASNDHSPLPKIMTPLKKLSSQPTINSYLLDGHMHHPDISVYTGVLSYLHTCSTELHTTPSSLHNGPRQLSGPYVSTHTDNGLIASTLSIEAHLQLSGLLTGFPS